MERLLARVLKRIRTTSSIRPPVSATSHRPPHERRVPSRSPWESRLRHVSSATTRSTSTASRGQGTQAVDRDPLRRGSSCPGSSSLVVAAPRSPYPNPNRPQGAILAWPARSTGGLLLAVAFLLSVSPQIRGPMKLKPAQVGRAGEFFVAAEIHRRGGYAVTFAGNMPGIDILASDVDHERKITLSGEDSDGWHLARAGPS